MIHTDPRQARHTLLSCDLWRTALLYGLDADHEIAIGYSNFRCDLLIRTGDGAPLIAVECKTNPAIVRTPSGSTHALRQVQWYRKSLDARAAVVVVAGFTDADIAVYEEVIFCGPDWFKSKLYEAARVHGLHRAHPNLKWYWRSLATAKQYRSYWNKHGRPEPEMDAVLAELDQVPVGVLPPPAPLTVDLGALLTQVAS